MSILVDLFDWIVSAIYFQFFASAEERRQQAEFEAYLQRSHNRTLAALSEVDQISEQLRQSRLQYYSSAHR